MSADNWARTVDVVLLIAAGGIDDIALREGIDAGQVGAAIRCGSGGGPASRFCTRNRSVAVRSAPTGWRRRT